ncbi:MAG: MATE family efflux transporter [Candidatus Obscuribacterales bacterium]|nr:MATE family efflux transporter [Candidatus Obscuribacterales bacterium]
MNTSVSELELSDKTNAALNNTDAIIVSGSLWRAIWQLSWPLYLNMMIISVATISEIWVGGRLGSAAQAAVGLGGQIWFFMIILVVALSAGTNALVSRFWGAGDIDNAVMAARQSLLFSIFFGIFSCAVGLVATRPLLRALGASPEVEQYGWDFLKFDMIGQIPITVHWVSNSIFRARGNTKLPMFTMVLVVTLVVALNYILCIYPFHVGISGLGMSWTIASCLGVALSLYFHTKTELKACLAWNGPGMSKDWFIRIMKIGIPACVQDLAWVGGNFVLLYILARTVYPTACEAAWAIGLRVEETFGGMPIYALSASVATMFGQNLGAKKPERAELAGWKVTAIGAIYNLVVGIILYFAATPVAGLMSKDPMVIEYSAQYLQIVGLSQPFVAAWLILVGALQGAGYTRWPMVATVIALVVFRLPFAWYLTISSGWGPIGTWTSLAVSSTLVGLVLIYQFKRGSWKTQEV